MWDFLNQNLKTFLFFGEVIFLEVCSLFCLFQVCVCVFLAACCVPCPFKGKGRLFQWKPLVNAQRSLPEFLDFCHFWGLDWFGGTQQVQALFYPSTQEVRLPEQV